MKKVPRFGSVPKRDGQTDNIRPRPTIGLASTRLVGLLHLLLHIKSDVF